MKAPRVQPPLVEPLTDAELRALLGTCTVPQEPAPVGERLHHRRDEAIIRLILRPPSAPESSSASVSTTSTSSDA